MLFLHQKRTDSSQQVLRISLHPLIEEILQSNTKTVLAKANNNDQAPNCIVSKNLNFYQILYVHWYKNKLVSLPHSTIDNTECHIIQPQSHDYRWTRRSSIRTSFVEIQPCQFKQDNSLATDPDELHQFDRLKVWELVDKPFGKMIIKLKWLWKNNEGVKDPELCSLGSSSDFRCPRSHTSLFQSIRWNGKRISNGTTEGWRLMLLSQNVSLIPDHPEKVYLLRKALYGLKQAPRAWSGCLDTRKSTFCRYNSLVKTCKLDVKETELHAMSSAD
ncbi:hypothetical protein Tco_0493958 [Tanacetum coccineum]